jgi:hypothetical protein
MRILLLLPLLFSFTAFNPLPPPNSNAANCLDGQTVEYDSSQSSGVKCSTLRYKNIVKSTGTSGISGNVTCTGARIDLPDSFITITTTGGSLKFFIEPTDGTGYPSAWAPPFGWVYLVLNDGSDNDLFTIQLREPAEPSPDNVDYRNQLSLLNGRVYDVPAGTYTIKLQTLCNNGDTLRVLNSRLGVMEVF